ncbi:MAG: ferrous iron transport protein B [Clostridia bacterium]|nr:ferrous iron transport protein B [Clostridia bacterium]
MSFVIALAGNPNSGKTTLFNELTGSTQYVGNWPGVTVEKKEGRLTKYREIAVVDLPGIYSLSPYTPEEIISRDFIIKQQPDIIINIIDATNLERNLYLTLQLLETDIPVVAALNMIDVIKKRGEYIDKDKLSQNLGCPVVETSASKGIGIDKLTEEILKIKAQPFIRKKYAYYDRRFEYFASDAEKIISGIVSNNKRWYAVKLLENDQIVKNSIKLDECLSAKLMQKVQALEKQFDDDCDSIIADVRYNYIAAVLKGIYIKKTDRKALSVTEKIDRIATNKWLALPIFFIVLWAVYYISVQTVGSFTVNALDGFFKNFAAAAGSLLNKINTANWLKGLICEGIIGGVGAVLVFVPQLVILFLLLSFLEDSGYMSRIAFIMDRVFRHFGLSGKSFIPMLIGTGCSVPAITGARTIENKKDRRMTIILTPFIPCGAKLPIFALIGGAVFPDYSLVAPSMYFMGIFTVIICGIMLKNTRMFKGEDAPFVMELPEYRMPSAKGIFIHMWERSKDFIIKAGTVIFAASCIIWVLVKFNWSFEMVQTKHSMLASIGKIIAPLFLPLGFGNWQCAVATLTGYAAKENIVATLGIVLGHQKEADFAAKVAALFDNPAAAYGFMVFVLLAPPCFAAISVMKRELGSLKWFTFAITFQLVISYTAAFFIYQIGSLFFYGGTAMSSVILTLLLALVFIYIIIYMFKNKNCKNCAKCAYKKCTHKS